MDGSVFFRQRSAPITTATRTATAVYIAALAVASAAAGDLRIATALVAPTLDVFGDGHSGYAVNAINTPGDEQARYVIRRPGAYYLPSPLLGEAGKAGIDIAASHVTLDLRGFALTGAPGAVAGVRVRGAQSNITIRNGSLYDWPAIALDAAEAPFSTFEDLRAVGNGTGLLVSARTAVRRCLAAGNAGGGMLTGQGASVESCTASFNKGLGIYVLEGSRVRDCTMESNAADGLYLDGGGCEVIGCIAIGNGLNGVAAIYGGAISQSTAEHNGADGMWSIAATTFVECRATLNQGDGIEAGEGSTVRHCIARENGQDGLRLAARVEATGNHAEKHHAGAGIRAAGGWVRIDGNTLAANAIGVRVEGTGCLVVRNGASASTTQAFDIAPGNAYGPIVDVAGVGDLSQVPGSGHPLANLVY